MWPSDPIAKHNSDTEFHSNVDANAVKDTDGDFHSDGHGNVHFDTNLDCFLHKDGDFLVDANFERDAYFNSRGYMDCGLDLDPDLEPYLDTKRDFDF
jgi:hypothetical protein